MPAVGTGFFPFVVLLVARVARKAAIFWQHAARSGFEGQKLHASLLRVELPAMVLALSMDVKVVMLLLRVLSTVTSRA